MASNVKITAQPRGSVGTSNARRLRATGWLPCVLNTQKGEAQSLQVNHHDFETTLRIHGKDNLLLDLDVGGKTTRVILKDIQYHAVDDTIAHADFVEISMTRKMRVGIPIVLVGDPIGVTAEAGILSQVLRELEVECLPGDLVDNVKVSVEGLHINQAVFVRDIAVPSTLHVLSGADVAVATVSPPAAEEEVAPAADAAAVEPGAEPELIREKKETDEETEGEEGEAKKPEKGKAEKPAGKTAEAPAKTDKAAKPAPAEKPERKKGGDKK